MMRKKVLWLALILCAALILTGCQQKAIYDTTLPQDRTQQTNAETAEQAPVQQDVFGSADASPDYDDGSYDPTQEEGGDWESVDDVNLSEIIASNADTPAPTMQSEYAGATPALIDPIDKPTPTPLPKINLTYMTYEAAALHMSFEGPAGWTVDESVSDTFRLTNPDTSMDYAAELIVRAIPVNKQYSRSELSREVKGMLDTLSGSGDYKSFEPSNTADRTILGSTGVYANYKATLKDGTQIAGRMIVVCVDKTLYTLHVTYPRGYTDFYVENVYNKFRHSVKLK